MGVPVDSVGTFHSNRALFKINS